MAASYTAIIRQQRPPLGTWYVCIVRRSGGRAARVIVSGHATRPEAEAAREVVARDPAAHWREPAKRGPKPMALRWSLSVRQALSGVWKVSLSRVTRGPGGSSKAESVVATCATEAEARAEAARIRLDPEAHWREPRENHPQTREAKRRATARRVVRERVVPVEQQPEPIGGGWLLGCGLHEAARPVHPCPVCARAAELTEASLREATSHAYAGMVRKMREEAA